MGWILELREETFQKNWRDGCLELKGLSGARLVKLRASFQVAGVGDQIWGALRGVLPCEVFADRTRLTQEGSVVLQNRHLAKGVFLQILGRLVLASGEVEWSEMKGICFSWRMMPTSL